MRIHTILMQSLVCAALAIAGCATPPPVKLARTTVVLMPDEDGNVGVVSVTTDAGSQKIDQAYSFATVDGAHAKPSDVNLMGRESVDRAYEHLMQAQPPKPKTFVLNFMIDRTALTDESKAMIPAVLAAIGEHKPTEITIFGHADATGTEKRNLKLSADRANVIATLLRKTDPSLDRIDVQWFGDRAPLVPSEAGKPQPKNRRAEILVL